MHLCNSQWMSIDSETSSPWLPNNCQPYQSIRIEINEVNVDQKSFDQNDFIEIQIQQSPQNNFEVRDLITVSSLRSFEFL